MSLCPYQLTDIEEDKAKASISVATVFILKYKSIHLNIFVANKNDDVDSWLFSMKQYAEIVYIPILEIIQFVTMLL